MLVSFNSCSTKKKMFGILNLLSIQILNEVLCGLPYFWLGSTQPHKASCPQPLSSTQLPHRKCLYKNHESDLITHLFTTFLSPMLPTGLKLQWLSQATPFSTWLQLTSNLQGVRPLSAHFSNKNGEDPIPAPPPILWTQRTGGCRKKAQPSSLPVLLRTLPLTFEAFPNIPASPSGSLAPNSILTSYLWCEWFLSLEYIYSCKSFHVYIYRNETDYTRAYRFSLSDCELLNGKDSSWQHRA